MWIPTGNVEINLKTVSAVNTESSYEGSKRDSLKVGDPNKQL